MIEKKIDEWGAGASTILVVVPDPSYTPLHRTQYITCKHTYNTKRKNYLIVHFKKQVDEWGAGASISGRARPFLHPITSYTEKECSINKLRHIFIKLQSSI